MSKLVLEPETHSGISRAGAIPSLVRSCINAEPDEARAYSALSGSDLLREPLRNVD